MLGPKPVGGLLVLALWAAVAGCQTESSTTFNYPNPLCLEVDWAELASVPGVTPPTLSCASTLECPPPLTCQKRGQQRLGECSLLREVIDPSAPAEVYGLPEFLLSVEQGDDYNLLSFNGLPGDAAVLRCNFYICPMDADVLREASARCRYASEVVNLGLTGSLALGAITNGPDNLSIEANLPACGLDDSAGGVGESIRFSVAAVGYYAVCYAFSQTALIAVSAVSGLSREEVGRAGQDAYQTDCSAPTAIEGGACPRTAVSGADTLGVCVGETCCAPCWSDRDCEPLGGTTCLTIQALSAPADGGVARPVTGFCADVTCSDRRGDLQCAVPALRDGGVQQGASAWVARDTERSCAAAFLDDAGAADAGAPADAGLPGSDAGPADAALADAAPADAAPPPRMP